MSSKITRRPSKKKSGFVCSFCGEKVSNPSAYYSQLTDRLTNRFIGLLNSNNGQNYFEGVLDSIHAVFGPNNLIVKERLIIAGYYDKFEERFGKGENLSPYKLRCYVCKELKNEWEITVDTSTRPFAEYICEDCLAKKQGR